MNKIFTVVEREYLTSVQKKSFLILTFLAPILLLGAFFVIGYFTKANMKNETLLVLDQQNFTENKLKGSEKLTIRYLDSQTKISTAIDSLSESEIVNSVLIIPSFSNESVEQLENNIVLKTKKSLSMRTITTVEKQLNGFIKNAKVKQYGLNNELIAKVESQVDLIHKESKIYVDEDGNITEKEEDKSEEYLKLGLSYIFNVISYLMIMMYGMKIMRSVVEEKSSRIVEVMISSIKPFQLLMGKLIAGTMVALTQLVTWILTIVVGIKVFESWVMKKDGYEQVKQVILLFNSMENINVMNITFLFLAFFVLGYAIYGAIFGAIGAGVDNDREAQQFTFPVTLPLIISFYIIIGSVSANQTVEGPVIQFLSFFPLSSPVVMVARLPFGVPLWEIILSLVILILSIVIIIKFAAKIYKIGILMYGKKASFKEFIKWMRY